MQYRAEIDGLRALAVIPVILFHAGFEIFSGGFVGVDVFFVISGYLITTIILNDIEKNQFSVIHFYERRARRILPALFFVMLACIPFAWIWMLPEDMKNFSQSLFAVSFFASNILFFRESGYFDNSSEEKPLLHTWSLAVEEQFYVFFPIFIILIWRFGKNRVFWIIFFLALISLVLSEWGWRNNATKNFYLTPSRVWELFAGSIAALYVQKKGVKKNDFLASAGIAAIILSVFVFDEQTPSPSIYILLPVLGAVLLVLFGKQETFVGKLLSSKAFVLMGLISYSTYLWHQPLFAFARIRLHEPEGIIFLLLALLSMCFAYISWRFIEQPFRGINSIVQKRSTIFAISICGIIFFSTFGLLGHFSDGFKNSSEFREQLSKLEKRIEVNNGMSDDCEVKFNLSKNCANSESPTLLLWGDSYAMHLYQGIYASNPELKIRQHTSSNCSPIIGISRFNPLKDFGHSSALDCINFNNDVFSWLKKNKSVEHVILSSPFNWVGFDKIMDINNSIYDNNFDLTIAYFIETIEKIKSLGVEVVVVSPTPSAEFNIGKCLIKNLRFDSYNNCNFKLSKDSFNNMFFHEIKNSVNVYWLYKDICREGLCYAKSNKTIIYRDAGHLSKEGSYLTGKSNHWYSKMVALASEKD